MKASGLILMARRYIAINSTDRNIRIFLVPSLLATSTDAETPEPVARMTDTIGRTRWSVMTFSGDGEHLFAGNMTMRSSRRALNPLPGSDSAGSHEVFVWDVGARGQYLKTMENGKEPLMDLDVGTLVMLIYLIISDFSQSGTHTYLNGSVSLPWEISTSGEIFPR